MTDTLTEQYKISFSRLNLFHQCPEQFRRRYLEREYVDHGLWAGAGSLFHLAASHMTNPYKPEIMRAALIDIGKSYPADYLKRALKFLPAFDNFMANQAQLVNYQFVKTELELRVQHENLLFHGFVDLVQRGQHGLVITDWKLGRKRPENIAQLQTYAPLVAEIYDEPVSLLRDVYFKQDGTYKIESFVPAMTKQQVLEIFDEAKDLLYQPGVESPAYPAWGALSDSCKVCPFRASCPGAGLAHDKSIRMEGR